MEKVFIVEGMQCEHCKKAVEAALLELEGVTAAKASLEKKEVCITLSIDVDDEVIKEAIREEGYEV